MSMSESNAILIGSTTSIPYTKEDGVAPIEVRIEVL